jgi:hypothetical protein
MADRRRPPEIKRMLEAILEFLLELVMQFFGEAILTRLFEFLLWGTGRIAAALMALARKTSSNLAATADECITLGIVLWLAFAVIGVGCWTWKNHHRISMHFRVCGREIFRSRSRARSWEEEPQR